MKIINVAGKQLIVMGKGIKDLPLSASKKNPGVMRHQGQALPETTEGGIPIVRGEGDSPAGRIHEDLKRAEERKKARASGDTPGSFGSPFGKEKPAEGHNFGKAVKLVVVLRKGQAGEHPFSESQRRWAWAAEDKGELEPGTAHKWSKRVEGKKLPKHTEDGEPVHAQD